MQRFNALITVLLLVFATGASQAQSPAQLGKEYVRLSTPQPVTSGERIEVIEFFYYGCPICYELEPTLSRWHFNAPASVALRRVPAISSDNWDNFARLFYTLEAVGQLGRLHWPVYDNFHFNGLKLNEESVMADWVAHNGVNRQKFLDTFRSPEVQAKLDAARAMMRSYDIRGVPTIVVDGKFATTASMAGGTREMMQVVDRLIDMARKERAK